MARKVSDETRQLMYDLHDEGLSIIEIASRANVAASTSCGYIMAREKGFSSDEEYREAYRKKLAKKHGFDSYLEYQEHLLKQKGFDSPVEYREHLAKQKQKRPENQELSNLIKRRLKELKKDQTWLSRQVNVSRESISKYVQGKYVPNARILEIVFSALDVPYKTLDDLMEHDNGL